MTPYLALFRGINVGGKHRIPMKDLVPVFESLGCQQVQSYIQTGNVLFLAEPDVIASLYENLGEALLRCFGFVPEVLLLDRGAFLQAIAHNPFPTDEGKSLHLFFLKSVPLPDIEGLSRLKIASEAYQIHGQVFYLYAPEGIGRSKLAEKAEKLLGVPATARNWNTVRAIWAKLCVGE